MKRILHLALLSFVLICFSSISNAGSNTDAQANNPLADVKALNFQNLIFQN